MTGIYLLLIELPEDAEIRVRSGKTFALKKGLYVYVGSALNGLEARIRRHLRTRKRLFWHVDYLLQRGYVQKVILARTQQRLECTVARALARRLAAVAGFGCSDCRCVSHLFFAEQIDGLSQLAAETLKAADLQACSKFTRLESQSVGPPGTTGHRACEPRRVDRGGP